MFYGQIIGRLARDPELKQTASSQICTFTVAVDQGWGDKKRGVFWRCKAFGKTAERIDHGWVKGKPIFAVGRIEEETWNDKNGVAQRSTILLVDSVEFVPGANDRPAQAPQQLDRGFDDGDDIPL